MAPDASVANPGLGDLTDCLNKLRNEFREAAFEIHVGYTPLRDTAMVEWLEEISRHSTKSSTPWK